MLLFVNKTQKSLKDFLRNGKKPLKISKGNKNSEEILENKQISREVQGTLSYSKDPLKKIKNVNKTQ